MNTVLVVGGYGVFGGRLAQLLLKHTNLRVVCAGRSLASAQAFCKKFGGLPFALDRSDDLAAVFAQLRPAVVIDAAGPFQNYRDDPYRLARAALATGAHYLDLSDDAGFTAGISALNAQALQAGRVAISGVSSVPAISSAAVEALAAGLTNISGIETVILPGNRAPRGLSVVQAIASQAGNPIRLCRGGQWTQLAGWSGLKRVALSVGAVQLPARWTSVIGAPDLALFPGRYRARSVLFRAGLELPILHLGLWLLAWLPRAGLLRSLLPLAGGLRWLADRFLAFGSDRGGMCVAVQGRTADGRSLRRQWSLIVASGDGPFIPAIPAFLLTQQLLTACPAAGARPCLGELSLAQLEAGMQLLDLKTATTEQPAPCLYEQILGAADWGVLPVALQDLHDVQDWRQWTGAARVENGRHPLARFIRRLFGFPPASASAALTVTLEKTAGGERWTRQFGRHKFRSHLSLPHDRAPGVLVERFGPLSFRIRLPITLFGLTMPVQEVRCGGLRLPRVLQPASETREFVDDAGRFCFDVAVSLPRIGVLMRYSGHLQPALARAETLEYQGTTPES